jgi:hypothetical protein
MGNVRKEINYIKYNTICYVCVCRDCKRQSCKDNEEYRCLYCGTHDYKNQTRFCVNYTNKEQPLRKEKPIKTEQQIKSEKTKKSIKIIEPIKKAVVKIHKPVGYKKMKRNAKH